MLDDLGDPAAIELTTETPAGIRQRVFVLVFFNAFGAAFALFGYASSARPVDWPAVFAIAGLEFLLFGCSLFLWSVVPKGTWRLGKWGIEYRSVFGGIRSLAWSGIERVFWTPEAIILSGGGTKITLQPASFAKADGERARSFIEACLAPMFDLSPIQTTPEEHARRSVGEHIGRLFVMIAIGVSYTAVWFAGLWIIVNRWFDYDHAWIMATWSMGGLIMPQVPLIYILLCDRRRIRRIHPEYPWRRKKRDGAHYS